MEQLDPVSTSHKVVYTTGMNRFKYTNVQWHVDHYVFIIHEINMYYHRCMHVCLHVYRLFVYVCATVHVWVHVCVCMCVNKYKYTCTCRSVISYLLLSKQCTCNQFTIHFIMFIIYTYTCVHCSMYFMYSVLKHYMYICTSTCTCTCIYIHVIFVPFYIH